MSKITFHSSLALVIAIALMIAPFAIRPAAAGATEIPISAYNIACTKQEGKLWVEEGVLHIRGRVLQSVVISESEYHAGTGQIVGNANIDLATRYGTYHGTLEIYPAAKDGYWAGIWTMQVNESGADGIARLQGYGPDLEGWSIKSEITYLPPEVLAQYKDYCGGNQPISGTLSNGVILMPGGE